MRHHDIRLTLGAYGHLRPSQEQEACGRLEGLVDVRGIQSEPSATSPEVGGAVPDLHQNGHRTPLAAADAPQETKKDCSPQRNRNPLRNQLCSRRRRQPATRRKYTPEGSNL